MTNDKLTRENPSSFICHWSFLICHFVKIFTPMLLRPSAPLLPCPSAAFADFANLMKQGSQGNKLGFGQLRAPRIMRRLDRNDAKVYQDPQHAPDVSFHGRNECVFRQKVHLSRQLQELARP